MEQNEFQELLERLGNEFTANLKDELVSRGIDAEITELNFSVSPVKQDIELVNHGLFNLRCSINAQGQVVCPHVPGN